MPDAYGNQSVRYRNKDYEMYHLRARQRRIPRICPGQPTGYLFMQDSCERFSITEYMLWVGLSSRDAAYRRTPLLRIRKVSQDAGSKFLVRVETIIQYIGLPTKEEVKSRNYAEAIIRPFNVIV